MCFYPYAYIHTCIWKRVYWNNNHHGTSFEKSPNEIHYRIELKLYCTYRSSILPGTNVPTHVFMCCYMQYHQYQHSDNRRHDSKTKCLKADIPALIEIRNRLDSQIVGHLYCPPCVYLRLPFLLLFLAAVPLRDGLKKANDNDDCVRQSQSHQTKAKG